MASFFCVTLEKGEVIVERSEKGVCDEFGGPTIYNLKPRVAFRLFLSRDLVRKVGGGFVVIARRESDKKVKRRAHQIANENRGKLMYCVEMTDAVASTQSLRNDISVAISTQQCDLLPSALTTCC